MRRTPRPCVPLQPCPQVNRDKHTLIFKKKTDAQGKPEIIVAWKPIASARRTADPILVYDGTDMATACWDFEINDWGLQVPGAYAQDVSIKPTHWRSLPKPPERANRVTEILCED